MLSLLPCPSKEHVSSFAGATGWLNSEPLELADLRGQVVLVNFWTSTCINWLRVQPYIRAWSRAYRDDGLVVVGVHSPEFSFEHELDVVREATRWYDLEYPIAIDNDFEIWSAFDNRYWPALYFFDRNGDLTHHHFGEGRYKKSERVLQRLLGVRRDRVPVLGCGLEAEADVHHLGTPETYLGWARAGNFAAPDGIALDERHDYVVPVGLPINGWALGGEWTVGREQVVLEKAGGRIAYRFHARDANLVLSAQASAPIPFQVTLDGAAPAAAHGMDVDADGRGVLRGGRLYHLVRQRDGVMDRTLEITFDEAGVEGYVFSFG